MQPTNLALDGGGETEHGGAKNRLHTGEASASGGGKEPRRLCQEKEPQSRNDDDSSIGKGECLKRQVSDGLLANPLSNELLPEEVEGSSGDLEDTEGRKESSGRKEKNSRSQPTLPTRPFGQQCPLSLLGPLLFTNSAGVPGF